MTSLEVLAQAIACAESGQSWDGYVEMMRDLYPDTDPLDEGVELADTPRVLAAAILEALSEGWELTDTTIGILGHMHRCGEQCGAQQERERLRTEVRTLRDSLTPTSEYWRAAYDMLDRLLADPEEPECGVEPHLASPDEIRQQERERLRKAAFRPYGEGNRDGAWGQCMVCGEDGVGASAIDAFFDPEEPDHE